VLHCFSEEGSFKLLWKIRTIALLMGWILPASFLCANIFPEDSYFINPAYSKKISLDFKNASLSEVLKVFSKQANMNFIAKTDISALRVTLYLENVPVEEALEYVLSSNDLEYAALPAENTFFVTKKTDKNSQLVTKVFKLKYASVSNSALKNTFDSDATATSGSSGSSGSFASASSLGGMVDAVKMVLTRNGILVEDSRTNSLIITDVASQMSIIEKTIQSLDVTVAQILIEVDMLDISKSTSDLMGAKWGDTIFNFQGASKTSILPFDQTSALQDGKTTLIPVTDSSSSSESTSPYTAGKLDFTSMNVVVNFLRTRSDTKNLARPRILTLNNQMAQIHVSTDEAVVPKRAILQVLAQRLALKRNGQKQVYF
jgi:type II secretory pathway component GspD/PulD (secretin)